MDIAQNIRRGTNVMVAYFDKEYSAEIKKSDFGPMFKKRANTVVAKASSSSAEYTEKTTRKREGTVPDAAASESRNNKLGKIGKFLKLVNNPRGDKKLV